MPDHTRRLWSAARAAAVVIAFVALSAADARAQTPRSERAAARAELELRQRMLWNLEKFKRESTARPPSATRPAYKEVAKEFEQLQLVNYSLADAADTKTPLDYERVRKQSGELRKRASRLKDYLLLPEVESEGKREKGAELQTPEALREAVGRLDKLVNSFAWNPVFQQPDVVDLDKSVQASRDLSGIIVLSERIRKSAEELGKGLAKK